MLISLCLIVCMYICMYSDVEQYNKIELNNDKNFNNCISVVLVYGLSNWWIPYVRFPIQIAPVITLKNTKIYQPEKLTLWNILLSMEVFFLPSPTTEVTSPKDILTVLSTSSTTRLENSSFTRP